MLQDRFYFINHLITYLNIIICTKLVLQKLASSVVGQVIIEYLYMRDDCKMVVCYWLSKFMVYKKFQIFASLLFEK